jgi:hypothetical protein
MCRTEILQDLEILWLHLASSPRLQCRPASFRCGRIRMHIYLKYQGTYLENRTLTSFEQLHSVLRDIALDDGYFFEVNDEVTTR